MNCIADSFGASDIGRRRSENQDQFLIADLEKAVHTRQTTLPRAGNYSYSDPKGQLFVVADGMGGHNAGRRASELAVQGIVRFVVDGLNWPEAGFARMPGSEMKIEQALDLAQELIVSESRQHPDRHGMGTTATLALVYWPHLFLAHVGDSRCYLFREGNLQKLTTDHTLASLVARTNPRPGADAEANLQASVGHVVYNALGGIHADFEPEIAHIALRSGDAILLCTDGLTRHVKPEEMEAELAQGNSAEHSVKMLIEAANARGGHDNITVVVAHFHGGEERSKEGSQSTVVTFEGSHELASDQPSLGDVAG